jgi:GrpB-like predicted nucleotidyltransferase (UPF0157 family)
MDNLKDRIMKAVQEDILISPYNPEWPRLFEKEKNHLLSCLPPDIVTRIEHFGSTAIPGLSAKPIIDILVEVSSLEETKEIVVPILTAQGYEYFWRPSFGDDVPPFYAWFIKRNEKKQRTHHLHMIERNFDLWDRLFFRDYLIEHPEIAGEYESLKLRLAAAFPNDRSAYTEAKTEFVIKITGLAKRYYKNSKKKEIR